MSLEHRKGIARHLRQTRWYVNVRLERQPLCPRCSHELGAGSTHFVKGMAFCASCKHEIEPLADHIGTLMEHHGLRKHFRVALGLKFYCPTHFEPVSILMLLIHEGAHDEIIGATRGLVGIDRTEGDAGTGQEQPKETKKRRRRKTTTKNT